MTDEQWKWLFIEGLTPLFGAGVLYIMWGAWKYLAASDKTKFSYRWREALDSLGWLYGALIIAIQSEVRYFGAEGKQLLPATFTAIGGVCCLGLLLNAMDQRAQDDKWYAPLSMIIISIVLAVGILIGGCQARALAQSKETTSEQPHENPKEGKNGR